MLGVETVSRIQASERDELSQRGRMRKLCPGFEAQNGTHFPLESLAESASRNPRLEWDTLSGTALNRKLRPRISLQSGMSFPVEASGGKFIPELALGVGHGFRIGPQRKTYPSLSVYSGMRFPLGASTGKCVPVWWAGGHKLSSPYSSISLSHVGRMVWRMPAVCNFFASIPAERTSFMVKRMSGWP